jgi:hypothetical protein
LRRRRFEWFRKSANTTNAVGARYSGQFVCFGQCANYAYSPKVFWSDDLEYPRLTVWVY